MRLQRSRDREAFRVPEQGFGDAFIATACPFRGKPELFDTVFADVPRLRGGQRAEHGENRDGSCFFP